MQKIHLPAWCPEIHKVSRWVLGNMQFNVLLSNIAGVNEMRNAVAILRDRPDIYRHRIKHDVNNAVRTADQLKATYMYYTNHPGEFDEFSDNVVDKTESDVTKLRLLIMDGFRMRGKENGELREWLEYKPEGTDGRSNLEVVAWVSTALMLLHLANEHYRVVMQTGNERACRVLVLKKMEHLVNARDHQYQHHFFGHCPASLLSAWQTVERQIDPLPDVLVEKPILTQLKIISKNYGDGIYLRQCLDEMKDNERFNSVVVRNEKE